MVNGAALAAELRGKKGGGIPWMVILSSDQKALVTSDGPKGNVGCPVTDAEIAWFMKMIAKTAKNLDKKEQAVIEAELTKHAIKIRNKK